MSSAQAIEQVMPERAIGARVEPNPRRPKRGSYTPQAETLSLLKTSGNAINFSNPSGSLIQGTIQAASITNAMLANSTMTVDGSTCTWGSAALTAVTPR